MFNNLLKKYYSDDIPLNGVSVPGGKILSTTEDASGAQHENVVAEYLDPTGEPVQVSAANPFPVLASINTTGLATSANQTTEIAALVSIAAEDFATQATLAALNAKVTTVNTGAVVVSSSALPTLAATSTKQSDGSQKTQIVDGSGNVVGETSNALDVNIKSGTASITLPADSAPATQNITTQDLVSATASGNNSQSIITGTPTANSAASFAFATYDTVRMQVSGTWTGTLQSELSMDGGTTWYIVGVHQTGTSYSAATFTGNFSGNANIGGATNYRLRATAAMTGTAVVKIILSINDSTLYLANAMRLQDATTQSIQNTIKAASTAATAADTALVVAISPNTPISVGATDNTTLYSNNISATGAITGFLTTGYASVVIQLSGTWQGNLVVEGCNDNILYTPLLVLNCNELSMVDVIYGNGNYQFKTTTKYVRLNVLAVSGTITALIVGRTVLGISGADTLSLAMDRGNNAPLYVSEIDSKKDLSKALIPSDAPAPIYGWAQATSSVIFQVDTTGYQSVAVQCVTFGSSITIQTSNDGNTWVSLSGYNANSIAASTATLNAAGMWEYPVLGKFIRGLMVGAVFTNVFVYLRQKPVNPFNLSGGGAINLNAVGGNTVASVSGLGATGAGSQITGAVNVGAGQAPGSTTVPYPIMVGGREAPSDGALGGKVRTLLLSTLGQPIVTGAIPAAQSTQNVASVPTQDQGQYEGMGLYEIMANILIELRINNAMMNELPQILNSDNGRFDDLAIYKNDFSSINQ